jgi:Winged helix DNA-binding domain
MDEGTIRAWWANRQGLDGTLRGKSAAEVLEQSGWARSVGGVGPYLTLFSRAGINREDSDKAVAKLEIHELPSARGCTYVVPASDFPLALRVGQEFGEGEMKVARKLGVTDGEIDKLCSAIVSSLGQGPLDPEKIREATGSAARNLGPEGKKKGMITTLPLALGRLQSLGEIRRIPSDGRLDHQRYQYALWRPNPLSGFKLAPAEAYVELARRFFQWIGPATMGEFQWFSGLGVKASKSAVEPLKIVALENGSDRLMFPEARDRLMAFKAPAKPQYSLVSSLDAISALRRDVKGLLDSKDWDRRVFSDNSMKAASELTDLPNHAVLDRGRLVGLWEYDTETQSIAWTSFGIKDKALNAAVEHTEKYIRAQLGDARSFGLDSPKSRVPRVEALRKRG